MFVSGALVDIRSVRELESYDGPAARRGVVGMVRTVRADGTEWKRADVPAFRRCVGLPDPPAAPTDGDRAESAVAIAQPLYEARTALVRWLGAGDPAAVTDDPSGAVRFRDPRGGEHTLRMVKHGCQWHLGGVR